MDYFELRKALNELTLIFEGEAVEFDWSQPTQAGKGLLSSNCSFALAGKLKRSPVEVAKQLTDELCQLKKSQTTLDTVLFTAEGPFINLYLSQSGYEQLLTDGFSGFQLPTDVSQVMFEYIGANVAKRLHAGHMRNLNIGEALRRVLSLRYPNLITDNHWGDWGVQFGVLLWAYKQEADDSAYAADPMEELQRLYVWGNAQESKVDNWAEQVRDEFRKLEQGDDTNTQLWQQFLTISKQELQHDLKLLNVPQTDLEQGESFYEQWMERLVEFCDEHNLWAAEGLARYVDFEQLAEDWTDLSREKKQQVEGLGRAYFVSSQGYTTYVFRDVAARLQWAAEHKIELAVTLTDNRQRHNFEQAFAFISYLATTPEFSKAWGSDVASRLQLDNLKHIGYGYLSLTTGTLSSRQGGVLRLSDIFETVREAVEFELASRSQSRTAVEVDVITRAALKWQDLRTDPNTDVTLNPRQAVSFEGDTGVYQLYTYARLKSILRKSTLDPDQPEHSGKLLTQKEKDLLLSVYWLHEEVELAAEYMNVAPLVNKLGEITRSINGWYESTNVLEADHSRQQTLLGLVGYVASALSEALGVIGIDTLEEL